jgi:hypothetical protein
LTVSLGLVTLAAGFLIPLRSLREFPIGLVVPLLRTQVSVVMLYRGYQTRHILFGELEY